ncbi:MAG TPA: mechanosensitive ion channel family protein [Terriglobales bacterium]|nr:mechanosensitive ion channel family protein [Terriglobales bacterium]
MFSRFLGSAWFHLCRLCLLGFLLSISTLAQAPNPTPNTTSDTAQPEAPTDALGRTTPRGTVLGFLSASREGDNERAAQYLNTHETGKAAADLAHQLFVVLDHALPARLDQLSNQPEGSSPYSGDPNHSLVGTISSENGDVKILLDHVNRGKSGPVWLFSRDTLDSVPRLYDEVSAVNPEAVLPEFLINTQIVRISLFEWLVIFGGIPLFYLLAILLGWLLRGVVRLVARLFGKPSLTNGQFPDKPVRLLLLAFIIQWLLSRVHFSLLARQFWSSASNVIIVIACVWLTILAIKPVEKYARKRLRSHNFIEASTLLHLGCRVAEIAIIFVGFLIILRFLGVNATAALAGLGVGGIAVALAAQNTLENLVGGISLLSDDAVRVGDFLEAGGTQGTVENISLRSTRIRTLDRTLVNVPNGELASVSIATLSARDKYAVNPILGLRYGTTSSQMRNILDGIRTLLAQNPLVEADTIRVRFLRFGPSSLDVEVVAYILVRGRDQYLEVQEGLLLKMMECVESAGTQIALPAQAIFLASTFDGSGASALRNPTTAENRQYPNTSIKESAARHA